ncbi:MAG: tRNA 2-thiouridine(34) synthase MnmA [Dokdonella sp.]
MAAPCIMVGMSGGVDSSVAALLLQRAGRDIAGLFMTNWEEDDRDGPCHAEADRKDALGVCAQLGIAFHARNFSAEYWDQVFVHFLAEYKAGRTPNPDVLCNREIKFKTFLDHARELGCERIATGHYARIDRSGALPRLLRGHDGSKDQSYFLHALRHEQLAVTEFPVGDLPKAQVRDIAREAHLATHDKKDSTGICFIGERNFREFLASYLPAQSGDILNPDGKRIGTHDGSIFYTLGQRAGLGIGGQGGSDGSAWYVIGKNVTANVVYAAQGAESHWLLARRLRASQTTWISGTAPAREFSCTAKIRYRQSDQECSVKIEGDTCQVDFAQPQRAVTPGQSVVFYDGDVCLGGAIIDYGDAPLGGWIDA